MKHLIRNYHEIYSHSTVKVYRRSNETLPPENTLPPPLPSPPKNVPQKPPDIPSPGYRENPMKVQMLSANLYSQVFGKDNDISPDEALVRRCINELTKHGINIEANAKIKDVELKLPPLKGKDIEEHFMAIGREQSEPYRLIIQSILEANVEQPKEWAVTPGWTCYGPDGPSPVEYPHEEGLFFDVEVCVPVGPTPVMATAVGSKFWYSWVSPGLINLNISRSDDKKYNLDDMIPLGNVKLIAGHNVSYDRARTREQYLIQDSGTRFLDTMSLHVCVSGVTSYQRAMLKSKKELPHDDLEWSTQSSLNSLTEVHRLYCGSELDKEARDTFVNGTLQDVKDDFQNLMTYCSTDVLATKNVLKQLYPLFCERFPHPVTLAGMLEIGSAYLPVNSNWNRYIDECNLTYEDLDIESKYHLSKRADAACQLMNDEKYKRDLWMWDQDWSTQQIKMKKPTVRKKVVSEKSAVSSPDEENEQPDLLQKKFQYLYETKSLLPARRPLLPGYPAWYRKLCSKPNLDDPTEDWTPGANNIGTGMQIAPKLLSLCWEGYPLHYIRDHGWGFLIPFRSTHPEEIDCGQIPIERLSEKCPVFSFVDAEASADESAEAFHNLWRDVETNLSKKDFYSKARKDKTSGKYTGTGVWSNKTLEDCCWFLRLPHKNGKSFRVGNPLAKDFLNKFSDNVLTGDGDKSAERVIDIARMLSYWRNNRDRIMGQLVCWIPKENLSKELQSEEREFGAIIPQVVVCGTLTRRAMEPTWMTASNAQRERVGSELRSMIQAPKGYKIVGADVDSQELWIASVLGDAHATGMHGATPLGWMTLSGSKTNGTDMHSVTAKAVGISRDHAKVINYARIYGAGQNFAERLLKQFNPTFSDAEAKTKAKKMFSLTKGRKIYRMLENYLEEDTVRDYTSFEAIRFSRTTNKPMSELFNKSRWEGGTESAMFNRLEDISSQDQPVTPFLSCRLSRALEPKQGTEDRFLPTRVNWVVQSGAVDFLHLMLVAMRWLMGTNVRFCLSFHDELRYLVQEDLAYKAALAMHATNLLTRSFCVHRIGLNDLPMSVAFFSSVEVDRVLRKESSMDCKTPSNPHGLENGYGIPQGESLDIYTAIEKAGGNDMSRWEWHNKKDQN